MEKRKEPVQMENKVLQTGEFVGERIDRFLSCKLEEFSRSYIQRLMKEGHVKVGEKAVKANYKLCKGDEISIEIPDASEPDILPEPIPLNILYEDSDILIVNKPKGMVVHPAAGHYSGTLVNALMYHCKDSLSGINGVLRPGIVHRIDMDTTGSLLVCKHDEAHRILAEQLKQHTIRREYHAIVYGNLKEDSGTIDAPIGRHLTDRKKMSINYKNGKPAVTHYQVLERFGKFMCIWRPFTIHFWGMRCTAHPGNQCLRGFRGRFCTQKSLGFTILSLESIWSLTLRCQSILLISCKN